jgi:hypothetical protein
MKPRLLTATLFALAVACTKSEAPPKEQPTSAPAAPAAPALAPPAPAPKTVDFSAVDKMIAAATKPEDFENIYGECAVLGIKTMAAKKLGIKDVENDSDYWRHCKVDPARAEVQMVLKQSKKGKIHPACGLTAMNARHVADSSKPEAAEFKKLVADMTKPCDL